MALSWKPLSSREEERPADRSDRVDIRGARLQAARESAGLTYRELSNALGKREKRDGATHAQILRWEKGTDRRARALVVENLARVLAVPAAWLRGKTGKIPLVSRDPWIRYLNRVGQKHVGEWDNLELRRWCALARCVGAARRDYQQLEEADPGDGFDGAVWHAFEHLFEGRWLTTALWALPADGREVEPWFRAVAAPVQRTRIVSVEGDGTKPGQRAPSRVAEQRPQQEALLSVWEIALRPWWEGRIGFDYRFLATLPVPKFRQERSSPRELVRL